ncbi:RodZ domain-containing protein [Halomonas litopenaei]|uniref:RodZ domain-containing protein n=1 Tax=Halomonas litopenaei TaxID=2109328 RepID=UPI003FA15ED8
MSDSQYTDSEVSLSKTPSGDASPGALLCHERESQGLTREEVGAALNLRPAVIEGLEIDNYDEVPVVTYRRGYLRSYAQLLGVDVGRVMALYEARMGNEEVERKVTPVYINKPPSRLGAWLFRLMTLLVIAGLIGLTLMWWQSRGGSEPPEVSDNGPVSVDTIDGNAAVSDEATEGDDNLPPLPAEDSEMGLVDGEQANGDSAAESASAEPSSSTPSTVAATEAAAAEASETVDEAADNSANDSTDQAASTGGDDASAEQTASADAQGAEDEGAAEAAPAADSRRILKLTFNEQSWTEIFDSTNTRVFVGLQSPGTEATVEGEPPFRMTVGNATGVELLWGGEPVDLQQRAGRNNVARFTLGE